MKARPTIRSDTMYETPSIPCVELRNKQMLEPRQEGLDDRDHPQRKEHDGVDLLAGALELLFTQGKRLAGQRALGRIGATCAGLLPVVVGQERVDLSLVLGGDGHPVGGGLQFAPDPSILEHLQPGTGILCAEPKIAGVVRVLPHQECPLRVRHHGQVPAIRGAQGGDAIRGSVGIERIGLRRGARWVGVPDRCQAVPHDPVPDSLVGELDLSFTVGAPDSQCGAFHALEHDCRRLLDLDVGPPALKPARVVVDEPGLVLVIEDPVGGWNPAKEGHKLATVANSEREGVGSVVEGVELRLDRLVEADGAGPSLCRVHHVSVGEAPHENDPLEVGQRRLILEEVLHGDVPRLHAGKCDRSRHLPVSVAALLPQDGNLDLPVAVHNRTRGPFGLEWDVPDWSLPRRLHRLLGLNALGCALQLLQLERSGLPHSPRVGYGVLKYHLSVD
mmetsp:Transcript_9230/g.24895  ORF Transcript_9230/g.24895 Transcript_9230/m.24895 type:complete len:446 (-) Transcript_9230:929-2266(-)